MSLVESWGTDNEERRLAFPCDGLIWPPDKALYRGVTINTAPEVVFRWLCQMRVAPYSYDWIDNGGVQSPQELTPGLERLVIGQDVMTIFTLTDFAHDRHLTIRLKPAQSTTSVFGDIAVSYVIVPRSEAAYPGQSPSPTSDGCRLLVKLVIRYPRGFKGGLMRRVLPWGDLIMMRRQLLNFKRLAEKTGLESTRTYQNRGRTN